MPLSQGTEKSEGGLARRMHTAHRKSAVRLLNALPVKPVMMYAGGKIDTVHHYGQATFGPYVHTLTATDVASGWVELRSLLNNAHSHSWTFTALSD
ncbi:MAG: hypothetical protein LBP88_02940, partial [Treponema sp.]|nr:hypothetical protein [Treponema sp.]